MIVRTENLVKRYDDVLALDNVNFQITNGDIVGLLGPNGAGKSTLISCITSIAASDSGNIFIFDKPMNAKAYDIKKQIGIVPQELSFYPNLSAYNNVKFFASLYGLKGERLKEQIKRTLDFVGLWDKRSQKPKKYSGGMKRRLNIACAIVHNPKLIIMDEPTVGIDPQSRKHILDSIRTLNKEGATILYTSHYMEEVESICTYVNVMDKGRIIAKGTKQELKDMVADESALEVELNAVDYSVVENVKNITGVKEAYFDGNILSIIIEGKIVNKIVEVINECGHTILSVNMKKCSLEDVFFTLTGRSLRD